MVHPDDRKPQHPDEGMLTPVARVLAPGKIAQNACGPDQALLRCGNILEKRCDPAFQNFRMGAEPAIHAAIDQRIARLLPLRQAVIETALTQTEGGEDNLPRAAKLDDPLQNQCGHGKFFDTALRDRIKRP